MTGEGRSTAAAINAAISSADQRHSVPEQRRWKGYWTRYWCFKSQKREKRIVPAARPHGASESASEWPPAQAVIALAPPSSPASFVNSSVQSPASFTLSLSAASAIMCSPGPPNTMFTIGPYAHETQLVSPPVFSTFTTEPSTAPFTPPPESAHLTTPSSPEVPYAHYISSSLEAKAAARETISPCSTSTLASPCDTPASYTPNSGHLYLRHAVRETISPPSASTLASPCDTPASYTPKSRHLYAGGGATSSTLASPSDTPASYTLTSSNHYLGSPISCLVSPSVENSGKVPFSEEVLPAYSYTHSNHTLSSFPSFDPFFPPCFNHAPTAALVLPCDLTSMPEGLPAAVISESHMHEGLLKLSGAVDIVLDSEKGLDLRHLQELSNGSIPSKGCNSGHVDISGATGQSDVAFSTSSTKEYENCTDGERRLENSTTCELDEN